MSAMRLGVLLCLLLLAMGSSAAVDVSDTPKLVVEEYRLSPCSTDTSVPAALPLHLPDSIVTKRERWRYERPADINVDSINKTIGPLGFRLRLSQTQPWKGPSYDFLKGDSVVLHWVTGFVGFSYDRRTRRFLFTANVQQTRPPFDFNGVLVVDGKPQPWEPSDHEYVTPVLADGHVVTYHPEMAGNGLVRVVIRQDSQVVYSGLTRWNVTASSACLRSDGPNWIVGYADTVVVNGISLNRQLHCNAVHVYTVIDGAPFYLFTRNGKVRMHFGTSEQHYTYDYVQHGGECGQSCFSPMSNDNMVWFYARRDRWWYYVEAGVYDRIR
jgi:hypothetical protein